MPQRIVDLSLLIEDNMPSHKLFQRPVVITHMTHDASAKLGLGVPVSVKDLISVAGVSYASGSRAMAGTLGTVDAPTNLGKRTTRAPDSIRKCAYFLSITALVRAPVSGIKGRCGQSPSPMNVLRNGTRIALTGSRPNLSG